MIDGAIPAKSSEARRHHFVPQCWLAGFTDTGENDGRLWVTDLKQVKQWPTSPPKTGHRRDFYRASDPTLDPVIFEVAFSQIESIVAPILKSLYDEPRIPAEEELECLLSFIAIQYVRVPAFRPWILKVADSIHRSHTAKALKSPTSWATALKKAGIPVDEPAAAYKRMLEFERNLIDTGDYSIRAENEWFIIRGFKAALDTITPELVSRHWEAIISPSGRFIGTDNPVAMDGPKDRLIGFRSADVVLFPVNRHVLLCGTKQRSRPPFVNLKFIARHNTFAMLTSDGHIYSHVPDFCWLDETGKDQTDWKLFSRDRVLNSVGQ